MKENKCNWAKTKAKSQPKLKTTQKKKFKSLNNGPEKNNLGKIPDKELTMVKKNKDKEICKVNPGKQIMLEKKNLVSQLKLQRNVSPTRSCQKQAVNNEREREPGPTQYLIIYVNERKITKFCDCMEKSKLRIKSIEENHREGRKIIFRKAAQENVQPLRAAHAGPREHQ